MLPPRKPKKAKRSSRWRSQKHCNWLRGFSCANQNAMHECDGATEVAHVRLGSGAGMGQKPHDWQAVPLCKKCHAWQHSIGERSFWGLFKEANNTSLERLIDALCKASPCAREIREVRDA